MTEVARGSTTLFSRVADDILQDVSCSRRYENFTKTWIWGIWTSLGRILKYKEKISDTDNSSFKRNFLDRGDPAVTCQSRGALRFPPDLRNSLGMLEHKGSKAVFHASDFRRRKRCNVAFGPFVVLDFWKLLITLQGWPPS